MTRQLYGGRWRNEGSIGEGGQARAFLVTDTRGDHGTLYVLKLLKNTKRIERFRREVQAIRDLAHPCIVQCVDFELDSDHPYLVTEYCSGGSLASATRYWNESPVVALDLFGQICEGVAFAHGKGIVHRDIKPDNIFLRGNCGPAVVGDFGICFIGDDGNRVTLTDEVVGARSFTAPELEGGRSDTVSEKADVYSLGKLLYWLLSDGKTLPREKYRDPSLDIKRRNEDSLLGWNNIYLEHVNRLLDFMIIEDPNERRDLHNIRILLRQTRRLVEKEYNPISRSIRQLCRYCGQGFYVLRAKDNGQISNLGLTPVASCDWRAVVCNTCGHVELFRVDMAHRQDWWQ